jgi:hypothetical protein
MRLRVFHFPDELIVAIQGKSEESKEKEEKPSKAKRELPGQDPGTTYQPQPWSGKIGIRNE